MKLTILDSKYSPDMNLSPPAKSKMIYATFNFCWWTMRGRRVEHCLTTVGYHGEKLSPNQSTMRLYSFIMRALHHVLTDRQFYCAQMNGVEVWGIQLDRGIICE